MLFGWPTTTLPALGLSLVMTGIFGQVGQPTFPMSGVGALVLLVLFVTFLTIALIFE